MKNPIGREAFVSRPVNCLRMTLFASLVIFSLTGCAAGVESSLAIAKPAHFKWHNFAAACGQTYDCKVVYANHVQRNDRGLSPPLRSDVLDRTPGEHVGIDNFPKPAIVTWRSGDGVAHAAEVDIGAIFKDQVVRHRVPRGDFDGVGEGPTVLLIVEDRKVRVYMNARVYLTYEEVVGNPYSKFRDELTLAFEKVY